ncbi:MAG TPA: ShlB/FhaC/HecB family hemolysin secretion/activation protein [Allosphingosinicella sp.]|nr:ShlB/FhaC/HecB family hemolysin secretion/activation protein [Allosphingosinicella sp.]
MRLPASTVSRGTLFLSALSCASASHAQTPRAPTREEVERPRPPEPDRRPRLSVEGGIERAPCALAGEAFREIRFTPRSVSLGGLKEMPEAALRSAWEPFLGREQPVSIICEIRDRAATILREAGYVAAVEIPEQRIAAGDLQLEVLMAKLVAIRVRGDAGRSERTIARYLEKLTRKDVFNRYEAERYLLLARDLPGFDVRMALKSAGAGRGEVIGEVTVRRQAGSLEANIQNFGARSLGRWGGMVRGQLYGLTGLGDRTTLAAFTTADLDEQRTVQIGHEFRIGGEGLVLGGLFTYAWADPGLADPTLDIEARTSLATVEASYPVLRTQAATIRAGAGLDLIDQRVRFNGLKLSRDTLRVGFARLDFDRIDRSSLGVRAGYSAAEPLWRIGGRLELRQGLDLFGATEPCGPGLARCALPGVVPPSRLEGDPTATLLRLEVLGEYRPRPLVTLAAGLRAQMTGDPLLSFEQYSAGNYTVGRGYDPGTLLADRGIGAQIELRYGSLVPTGPRKLAWQAFAFLDAARVSEAGRIPTLVGGRSLASAGGGIRAALGDGARLEAVIAMPLKRAGLAAERGSPRLLFSLATRLWPWSF